MAIRELQRALGDQAQRPQFAVNLAEDYYRQSLALAIELGMCPLQAYCHMGLGTLYATAGHGESVQAELAAAIAQYYARDMTLWPPQAEDVLARMQRR